MSRTWEWSIVLVTVAASAFLWGVRGRSLGRGDVVDASITLVPGDRDNLACALTKAVGAYRCRYVDDGTASVSPPEAKSLLAPYMTTERTPYLIPGLFETAGLIRYLSAHHEDARFTSRCKLRLIRFQKSYRLRFRQGDPWGDGDPAWIAEVVDCEAK